MFTACSPGLHDAAEDDVIHHRRFDRRATGHLAQHVGGEHDGVDVTKITGALVAPAHRGSHRFDDHDLSHGSTCHLFGQPTLAAGAVSAVEAVDGSPPPRRGADGSSAFAGPRSCATSVPATAAARCRKRSAPARLRRRDGRLRTGPRPRPPAFPAPRDRGLRRRSPALAAAAADTRRRPRCMADRGCSTDRSDARPRHGAPW